MDEIKIGAEITIDGKKCTVVENAEIEILLTRNETLQKEKELIEWGMYQLLGVLGLTNEECTRVKPEVLSGEESVFKMILKNASELFGTFMKTNMPGSIGRNAEEKVKKQFCFVDKLIPLLKQHDDGNAQQ